jgi:aspartate/tyrosine/aromatic aminotransferase
MVENSSEADNVRAELVVQLRESLAKSRAMMLNEKLDAKTREAWTQKHTNTAQVLNMVLRDSQLKDWEHRLRELEDRRHRLAGSIKQLENETATSPAATEHPEPDETTIENGGS